MQKTFRFRFVGTTDEETSGVSGVAVTISNYQPVMTADFTFDDAGLFDVKMALDRRWIHIGEVVDGVFVPLST